MKEIVFLLEEGSAKAMLEGLLPRILSGGIAIPIDFKIKQPFHALPLDPRVDHRQHQYHRLGFCG